MIVVATIQELEKIMKELPPDTMIKIEIEVEEDE